MATRRIPGLDGLRAFSILLVVIGHLLHTVELPQRLLKAIVPVRNAQQGVMVFFVLSGYLITRLLLQSLDEHGETRFGRFWVRRIWRLWPAWFVYIAVVAALTVAGSIDVPLGAFVAAATSTWNVSPYVANDAWFGHGWSLALEEQFYVFWPLVLAPLVKRRKAMWFCLAMIVAGPIMRTGIYFVAPPLRPRISMLPVVRFDSMLFGCLLALAAGTDLRSRAGEAVRRYRLIFLAAAMLLVDGYLNQRFAGAYRIPFRFTFLGVAVSILLIHVLDRPESRLVRFLEIRPIVYVGLISYSLYVWQPFQTTINTTSTGWFPLNIVVTVAAAVASYHLVEQPFLRWRDRRAERRDDPATSRAGTLALGDRPPLEGMTRP